MSNFNNPNLPIGMMHQAGFMNTSSPQVGQHQHNNPNYGNMGQVSGGLGGMGGAGMQYQSQQQQQPQPGIGGPGSAYGQSGMSQMTHQSQAMNPLNTIGLRQSTPMAVDPPAGNAAAGPALQQSQQPLKELNAALLCRFGQETVQEIVSRTQEVFQTLRSAQPPDGKQTAPGMDRKPKFQETLRNIRALFKRLRVIYEKIEEAFPTSEDTYFEDSIPFKEENEVATIDETRMTDAYRIALEEYRDIVEQLVLRNRHLKETVDHLRQIIWDVNTMLAMRKE